MHRKTRFKFGQRVNALSLAGKKVLGEYRGMRGSYGAYVYGLEVGSFESPSLHVCSTLTLEKVTEPKPKRLHRPSLKTGDQCSGLTRDSTKIIGQYMNSEGKHSWIRAQQVAHKVLTETLQKL